MVSSTVSITLMESLDDKKEMKLFIDSDFFLDQMILYLDAFKKESELPFFNEPAVLRLHNNIVNYHFENNKKLKGDAYV